jgi:vesicle coat complex subunit
LIGALKDANTEVRQMAAIALGSIADPQAIDALTAALKDTDPEVREHAARALSRIARGQRRGGGRFPVANFEIKEWQQGVEKIQKVEMEKVHKQVAKAHQEMNSWSLGPLDPREMVDEAMRQADKAFKQYEDSWRQLEANGWVEP